MKNFEKINFPSVQDVEADQLKNKSKKTSGLQNMAAGLAIGAMSLAGGVEAQAQAQPEKQTRTTQETIVKIGSIEVNKADIPEDWYKQEAGFKSEDGSLEFVVGRGESPDLSTASKIAGMNAKMKLLSPEDKAGGRRGITYDKVKGGEKVMQKKDGGYIQYNLLVKKIK